MNNLLQNLICLAKKTLKLVTELNKPATPAATVTETKAPVETVAIEESAPVAEKTPPVVQASAPVVAKATTDNLPEDSTLRRHALAHLKNILVAVIGSRPSDSIQSRHYDAEINSQIELCLVCSKALATATANYENLPKISVKTSPVTIATETEVATNQIPTDSILRRHYEAMLNS